ncbi:MAG: Eco57I restriction-modification methylase domain-containing protein [Deferribacterales bacterium]|nr:Eco57I restriction-modification methylase domain-containing protein [Deferribacterales bacterium]
MSKLKVQGYNPDVLSCIASLSNDEVFTPPDIVNAILDTLPKELFENPKTTFLDPACKSGVFLREIAKRLIKGLENKIPNLEKRIDHILHNQLFGIAITELTSLLSRRSLYCSKFADGKYSVSFFKNPQGNIRFKHTLHTWKKGKCVFCGASQAEYGEESRIGLESHAYEFIHTPTPDNIFNMKFDVVISNPPYQISDGGGNGASAMPIYQKFVQQAKKLKPRYIVMIIKAIWYAGGKGLDDFRKEMLTDGHIRELHDFPESKDCFAGVQIKGGVCYFLWDRNNKGNCLVTTHRGKKTNSILRPLLEEGCSSFIRYNEAISILNKVRYFKEESIKSIVSSRLPFGLPNTFKGNEHKKNDNDLLIFVSGNSSEYKGAKRFVPLDMVTNGIHMIPWHKVFIGKAGSGNDTFPHLILPKPFYGSPNSICNESYLVIGPMSTKQECLNLITYISSKFFRFMVLLVKNTQNAPRGVYQFVPMQDFSKPWTDEELYKKYNLTDEEIAFIESMIKPMDIEEADEER